jgi:outer membrane biosynthesis protein TonB
VNLFSSSTILRNLFLAAALMCCGKALAADDDLFHVTPAQVASTLEEYFQKATDALAGCRIRDARQEISLIAFKIGKYKSSFSRDEKKGYDQRVAALNVSVKQKVDSLVKVNLEIIRKEGRTAGNEFRQFLSAQQGLSEAELASVDEALLTSPSSEEEIRPRSAAVTTPPPAPVPAPEPPPQAKSVAQTPPAPAPAPVKPENVPVAPPPPVVAEPVPAPPASVAPSKQQKPDTAVERAVEPSAREEEVDKGRTNATTTAAKIRALVDDNKPDEAMTVFQIYQANLQRFLPSGSFAELKSAVESASARDRNERSRAQEQAQKIGRLLDQDRAFEASAELNKTRETLQQYLDKQEFRDLNSRVGQSVADAGRRQASALGEQREVRALLEAGKTEDAVIAFDKARPDLERGLSKEDMASLKKDVGTAQDALKDKKKIAGLRKRDIMSLIKEGKGAAALGGFTENRAVLQQYLDQKDFASLESDVTKANRDYLSGQERARKALARVDSLIACSRALEAHDLFEETGGRIRKDLGDDQRFFETKDRCEKAYGIFRENKAQAQKTAQKIKYLIARKEGRKADALLIQETARLHEYLDPAEFERLKSDTRRAKEEYESGYASARAAIASIEALLDKKKIQQAYDAYDKVDDDLDFYCNEDNIASALGKRVKDAYDGLEEKKQWAASTMKQIKGLVDRKRGDQASARLKETRAELALYADVKTLSQLDTSVARAGKTYAAAKARSEAGAMRIRAMIVQNQVEDAYAAFDTSESDLEFYLDPSAFSALKTLVEKFNSTLQGKKQEAFETTKAIDHLIDRNMGDTAFSLFRQNDAFLAKYLKPATYRTVAARAARAKADWDKNSHHAQELSSRLREMADRDRAEAAWTEFDDKRDFLAQYLDRVSLGRLETSLRVPYEFFMERRKQARTTVSVIKRMIGQNQSGEARAEFDRRDKDLDRFLPAEEYKDIKNRVAQAYEKSVSGRRDAKAASDRIRKLLHDNKITDAYKTFQDSRPVLELYCSKVEFSRLQTEVISAYDDQEDKRKLVKVYAKKLKQLVAQNKLWVAYKGFETSRRTLSEWLDAEEFNDLENTVVGAYEKARAKARKK